MKKSIYAVDLFIRVSLPYMSNKDQSESILRLLKPKRSNPVTDRYTVYTKVLSLLKQMINIEPGGHLVTMAMMIAGIVLNCNAQLSAMSTEIAVAAKEKSVEMRLRRRVKDERLEADVVYMPFARQILVALASLPLILVMDGSQARRGCMVLMVRGLYRKRALPIAWICR
ncbi:MAG: hypothetical protein HY781_00040 [Chloroflexi bacterium]|nr:hypothetical protein [Chloroflexota bacterium]